MIYQQVRFGLCILAHSSDKIFTARPLTKICKSLIKHKEINFDSITFITYVKEMPNLHTHTHNTLISDPFGVVKLCCLRGEGRRGREGRVMNGVRMKHMITLQ